MRFRGFLFLVLMSTGCGDVQVDGLLSKQGEPCAGANSCDQDLICLEGLCALDDSDQDGDPNSKDCAPDDPKIHHGAEELCDGLDNNCDEAIDEDFPDLDGDQEADCVDIDDDGDGTSDDADCEPLNPAAYPGAEELCDGADNNCDEAVDEGHTDTDGDQQADCVDSDDDDDGVPDETDCKPLDPSFGAPSDEICDGIDNDCDDLTDEDFPQTDNDTDGSIDCLDADDDNDGYTDLDDCQPFDANSHPGAEEICDGIDNNCVDGADENFTDLDGDGMADCVDPDADGDGDPDSSDCAPVDSTIGALSSEVCDGIDNDCDNITDNPEAVLGSEALCPALGCEELLTTLTDPVDGRYWIQPPESARFETYCLMDSTYDGGGWTLVAVFSDDGQHTWTWADKHLMTQTSADSTLGSLDNLNNDMKNRAYNELEFRDLMFIHSTPATPDDPIWALYGGAAAGEQTLGQFINSFNVNINYLNLGGIERTGGNLAVGGTLCSTDLYINPCGLDGETFCTGDDNAFGPAWSQDNLEGCPLDDPGIRGGVGPDSSKHGFEHGENVSASVGFGHALNLNTGIEGAGENYLWMLVRNLDPNSTGGSTTDPGNSSQ